MSAYNPDPALTRALYNALEHLTNAVREHCPNQATKIRASLHSADIVMALARKTNYDN